ncbi:hypothetical protein Y5W_02672 [Alcanivorax sp. 521-1]|uniref:Uncharacterized protein n=1 Tax=Alloalcanivorax profundimaris TaxID=2735259 RepID=A0ABS0ATB6_9GAMM|nr:hypothetical protein [Alloalcanivorax profundimaris]MBF5057378.1 hypothetical protein [Alloalcanivorax profundimaris]
MIEQLEGCEPLSQVWFVHDYIQLQMQDRTVTVLNEPCLRLPSGKLLGRDDLGFCDNLVRQIGESIQDAMLEEGDHFALLFSSGAALIVPLTADAAKVPEALELPGAYVVFNQESR